MAIIFNKRDDIHSFLGVLFIEKREGYYQLKEEYGEGELVFIKTLNGNYFISGEVFLLKPIVAFTNVLEENEKGNVYTLTYKEILDYKDSVYENNNYPYELVSPGSDLISGNINRKRIWLPKVRYKFLNFSFTEIWIKNIGNSLGAPESLYNFIRGNPNMEIFVPNNSNIKHVVYQIYSHFDKLIEEAKLTYLNLKQFELFVLTISEHFKGLNRNLNVLAHQDDVKKILDLKSKLQTNFIDVEGIAEMSNSMGMSKSKLQRIFKKVTGTSVYSFVLNCKMEKAIEMLNAKESVSNTAFSLGYSSVGNFTNAFKDHFNFLPSEV